MNKKDRTKYYKDYAEKNKEKLNKDYICEICGGKYKQPNKSNHVNTSKHQNGILINKLKKDNQTMKNIILDVNKKIENI
jgi:hypothetical protein